MRNKIWIFYFRLWLSFFILTSAEQNGTVSIKLQSGRPSNLEDDTMLPQLHLYLHPACTYRLAIAISWTELYGQVSKWTYDIKKNWITFPLNE